MLATHSWTTRVLPDRESGAIASTRDKKLTWLPTGQPRMSSMAVRVWSVNLNRTGLPVFF